MKKHLIILILSSIIPLVTTILFMNFISLNMTYVVIQVVIITFFISFLQRKNKVNNLLKAIIISLPTMIGFYLFIINELPGLWIAIPLILITAISGGLNLNSRKVFLVNSILAICTILISFIYIPNAISENLIQLTNVTAPDFEMINLDNETKTNNESLIGKVIVLDFFGTWCAPCISEMKELAFVQNHFKSNDNLQFIIACTDVSRDTPKKAKAFKENRNITFDLAYDKKSISHKRFGFSGVPALVILDKKGNIRLKHEGYNEAENLSGNLIKLIDQLLSE